MFPLLNTGTGRLALSCVWLLLGLSALASVEASPKQKIFLFNDNKTEQTKPRLPQNIPFNARSERHAESTNKKPDQNKLLGNVTASLLPRVPHIAVSELPPEGFEDMSTAQLTHVDVYFGGQRIVSTMATFDSLSIQFRDPASIVRSIPQISHPQAVISAISGLLALHSEDICSDEQAQDCGILSPIIADIIFDVEQFRAQLFINPLYLENQFLNSEQYLPAPQQQFSSIHSFSALVSGGGDAKDQSQLGNRSIFSRGKTRLLSQTSLLPGEGLLLDTLRLEHDEKKWTFALGSMDSVGLISPLVTTKRYLGLRTARTLNLRTDLLLGKSSPIYFFLNERSRVEIFKAGKLISSRFYSTGNQQLDTSSLPSGTYEITLRIHNRFGEKEQKHLFTRSSLLPPINHALHFFEFGAFTEPHSIENRHRSPQASDEYFAHIGSRFRLKNNMGGEFALLTSPELEDTLQAGLYYFLPNLSLQTGLLYGDDQSRGQFINLGIRHRVFSLNLNHYNLDSEPQTTLDENSLLRQGSKTNLTLGSRFMGGALLARATQLDNSSVGDTTEYSLKYDRPLFRQGASRIDLTVNGTMNDEDETLILGLRYLFSGTRHKKSFSTRWIESKHKQNKGLQIDGRISSTQLKRNSQAAGQNTLFAKINNQSQSLGLRLERDYPYGVGFVETQTVHQDNIDQTLYSAGAYASVTTESSGFTMRGSKAGQAGLVISLQEGQKQDSAEKYDVLINNQVAKMSSHSGKQLILLKPYQQYNISLKSKAKKLIHFDASRQKITLYPGNVTHLKWKITPVFVVVGQAVHTDQSAVKNARITNLKEFSATDEYGWFQIELTNMKTLQLQSGDGKNCSISLPERPTDEEVIVLDQLICHPDNSSV